MPTRTGPYLFASHGGYANVFDGLDHTWVGSVPTSGFGSAAIVVDLDARPVVVEFGLEGLRATDAQSLEVLWWIPPSDSRGNSMGFSHAVAFYFDGVLRVGASEILKFGNQRILIDPVTGERDLASGGPGRFFGSVECPQVHGVADGTSVLLRSAAGATLMRLATPDDPVDVQEHVGADGTRYTVTSQVFDFGPDKVQMAFAPDQVLLVTGSRLAGYGLDGRQLWEATTPAEARVVQTAYDRTGWLGTLRTDAGLALYRLGPTLEHLRGPLDEPGHLVPGGQFVRDARDVSNAITGEPQAPLGPVPADRLPQSVVIAESVQDDGPPAPVPAPIARFFSEGPRALRDAWESSPELLPTLREFARALGLPPGLHPFGRHVEERHWSEGEGIRELFLYEERTLIWCWRDTPDGPRYFRFHHERRTADRVSQPLVRKLSGPWPLQALLSEAQARLAGVS